MRKYLFFLILICCNVTSIAQQVTNIQVFREGDNVVITYNLNSGNESQRFDIDLKYSEDGGQSYLFIPRSIIGDTKDVSPGTNKKIVWEVLNDVEQLVGENIIFKLEATSKSKLVDFEMVLVQGGTFLMGSTIGESDERPLHSVTLSSFYIGKTEVTQSQWVAVMGSNPKYFKGDNFPVEGVSWKDVQTFIAKLNQQTGKNYRLPTEAEWEFAARGGNSSRGYSYSGSNTVGEVAWFYNNSGKTTHMVGTKAANELSLYDMSGNVWEWCADWYDKYPSAAQTNPTGPARGSCRVLRGGGGIDSTDCYRVAYRDDNGPGYSNTGIGFRLASSL